MYDNGQGVPEDDMEAVKWWRKAAEQGDEAAQYNLGIAYANGIGVPQDDIKAYALLHLAENGEGVRKDNVAAYAWFSLETGTIADGIQALRDLAKSMTPEQIAEAQELSKELLKKIEANKAAK